MAVTNRTRSEVFVRDRGVCAFSGKTLWALDIGPTPFWSMDWVDHIKPVSRGGGGEADNLVCASSRYNWARGNNTRGALYIFREGKPTYEFFYHFGEVPKRLDRDLTRYRRLQALDWYLNRCFQHAMIWCDSKYYSYSDTSARIKTAYRFLAEWRDRGGTLESVFSRRLVKHPNDLGTKAMLKLAATDDPKSFVRASQRLLLYFSRNSDALEEFMNCDNIEQRRRVLRALKLRKAFIQT